jgi:hypothetical protein
MKAQAKAASKYKLYLPTEQELIEEIQQERPFIVREMQAHYGVENI